MELKHTAHTMLCTQSLWEPEGAWIRELAEPSYVLAHGAKAHSESNKQETYKLTYMKLNIHEANIHEANIQEANNTLPSDQCASCHVNNTWAEFIGCAAAGWSRPSLAPPSYRSGSRESSQMPCRRSAHN